MKHKSKKVAEDHSGDNTIEQHGSVGEPTSEILLLTKILLDLEAKYEEAKKLSSEFYAEMERAELKLYDRMKDVGIDQFRTSEFGLISCANTLYGKISDMELASEWLKENGLFDEVLKYTAKKARVNEIIKKHLEEGKSVPPGFDFSLTKSISVRRA